MLLSFPPTTIIIAGCTVSQIVTCPRPDRWRRAGTSRKRDAKRDKSKFEVHTRGSIAEIGNVPIFVRSESWLFEKGRPLPDGGAMIGVINAIIYGRLRARGRRRGYERVRADRTCRFSGRPRLRVNFARVLS